MTFLFRIGAVSLLCLIPLALYFLFLATLNKRRRPTMLTGLWDYTYLLLGLSGFMLVGGLVLVSAIDSACRSLLFSGNFRDIREVWVRNSAIWSIIAGSYLAVLTSAIGLFMFLRKKVTVIYNIDPNSVAELLSAAIGACGVKWRPVMGGFEFGRAAFVLDDGESPTRSLPGNSSAFVSVQSFPLMHHVSLTWRNESPLLRQQVEDAFGKLLEETESPDNPAGGWFMTTAITLFFVMLSWTVFLIWVLLAHPKGL